MPMRTIIFVACLAFASCSRGARDPSVKGAGTVLPGALFGGAQAVVTSKSGKVQLLRGADGSISEARVGDRLGAKDALRTDLGEADVAVEGVKVRIHEATKLEIRSVEKRAIRARVRGSLESEVDPTSKIDVEVEDSDTVAHSEGGHFFVTADGRGVVAVASVTGTVHVSGAGKSVEVAGGEVSRVTRESKGPTKPSAALRRVLLSVQWPGQKATNKPLLPLAGRVEPGSRVFVQGEPVPVEEAGTFRADVPLKQGRQKIAVVTVDALGRKRAVESMVLRDDSLPDVKVKKKLWQWRRH